ncbi:addiction module HigA family antidote [Breznakibacter xylanolyticus]|uniref:Addiction module HigA family antidote n=1 Tax=Breznakibacter xylanolyticus TaxID=990 RepID=A0A2W7N9X6_9BACT|nr:HigA family addiction module antitoxin [Breznakibacter xylanolyticus]PZX16868.1 addiction module HigA family antidote [Breznakibacter xylanolyticus]
MIAVPGVEPNMIANNLEPFEPTHPGEVLKDEIEYRRISQRKLAAAMNVPYTLLNEVLNGKRPVNTEFALLIEAVVGLPAEPLLKMQASYNIVVTKRNSDFMNKLSKTRKMTATL